MRILNRRTFLKVATPGVSLALTSAFFPGGLLMKLARAASVQNTASDHFFVLLSTAGGMDATLGLDPQVLQPGIDDKDVFLEYKPQDILTPLGLKLGPAAQGLVPFAANCTIINGIMMRRDAGHDPLRLYMATGASDGKSPALPVELSAHGPGCPYGVLFNQQIYTADRSPVLSSVNDIRNAQGMDDIRALLNASHDQSEDGSSIWSNAEESALNSNSINDKLVAQLNLMKRTSPDPDDAQVVAAAFLSGASQFAEIDLDVQEMDTHSKHPGNHLKAQKDAWDKVANIFSAFKQIPFGTGTLFDQTTFMVITEFSRTPALNAAQGKDHNPFTNSALLAGKNVNGGVTVGASKIISRLNTDDGMSAHIGSPFNHKLGKVTDDRDGASFIYPENVAKTVAEIFGVSANFASVDDAVLPLMGAIKKT